MHNWPNHVKILVYLYVDFFIVVFLNSYSHTLKLPLFITIRNVDLNLYGFLVWTNIIDWNYLQVLSRTTGTCISPLRSHDKMT